MTFRVTLSQWDETKKWPPRKQIQVARQSFVFPRLKAVGYFINRPSCRGLQNSLV